MRLLAGARHNLCVVGDEDQSIYSWRGADIRNILEFEQDFPEAKIVRLEQNYRSTENILQAASAVVANNVRRKGKTLWTSRQGGPKIGGYEAPDGENEALFVADMVNKYVQEALGEVFTRLREEAPELYAPGARRKSDFFRDIAGSRYHNQAEDVAREASLPYDLLLNVYDKSIIDVENRPPAGELSEKFHRALARVLAADSVVRIGSTDVPQTIVDTLAIDLDETYLVGTGYGRVTLPFSGGVAKNEAAVRELRKLIEENYGDVTININPESIYTGALGASEFARRTYEGGAAMETAA